MSRVHESQSDWIRTLSKEAALKSTLERGTDIAQNGLVYDVKKTASAVGNVVTLKGKVEGSRGNAYKTMVQLDLADREVVDFDCACPAAERYPGMCKHEIGLAITYLASKGALPSPHDSVDDDCGNNGYGGARGFDGDLDDALDIDCEARPDLPHDIPFGPGDSPWQGPAWLARPAAPKPPAPRDTSAIVLDLMDDARRRRKTARMLAATPLASSFAEPISLVPTIVDDYFTSLHLTLRVRCGKVSYAVRNIRDLLRAWDEGKGMRFGAKLDVPSLGMLDERSRRLLEVLSRIEHDSARFAERAVYQWGGYYRGPLDSKVSTFLLDEPYVFDVLDAMMGGEVKVEKRGSGDRHCSLSALEVVEETPSLKVKLVAAADGGYTVQASTACVLTGSLGRAYCIAKDKARRCEGETADMLLAYRDLFEAGYDLYISAKEAPAFCRTIVPDLRRIAAVSVPDRLLRAAPESRFIFAVGDDDGDVVVDARVFYGDASFKLLGDAPWATLPDPAFADDDGTAPDTSAATSSALASAPALASAAAAGAGPAGPLRDDAAEDAVLDLLWSLFPDGASRPKIDAGNDEALYYLLTDGLSRLHAAGEVLLSERLHTMQAKPAPRMTVRAKVKSGLLDIALGASGMTSSELAAYLAGCRRSQRFVRLSDEEIVRIDDGAREALAIAEGLGISPQELADGVKGLAPSRAMVLEAMLDRTRSLSVRRAQSFKSMVDAFDSLVDVDLSVPASLNATLRPYQEDGVSWMGALEALGCGGILADDMGLGKTLQAITHLLARREAGDAGLTLVVCPASLVYNWMAELERFAPALRARAVLGSKDARRREIESASHADASDAADAVDVLVTSYDLMRRDIELYQNLQLRRAILDEAHYIKNPGAQVTMAAKCLPAQVRFALAGTPMENRLGELWSIFDFIMPGFLGTRTAFEKHLGDAIAAGEAEATLRLRRMTSPFILRRLKEDVLADLPEKNESVVSVKLEGEQRRAYLANEERIAMQVAHELPDEFSRKKLQVLAELTRLRQLCCDPHLVLEGYRGPSAKLEACVELVAGAVDGGHQVLVFSQFTSMLAILSQRLGAVLRASGCTCEQLDGSCSKKKRAELVARFQEGRTQVLLISLKAGGVGLNLTAADVVIHYDPWWNVAAQQQATDRAHRIGQQRCVSVFKLIAAGTIEERIMAMQEAKRDLTESVLSGASTSAALTREDLLSVLGASAALAEE